MLKRTCQSPLGWLWCFGSLAAIPLLRVLTPPGLFGHGHQQEEPTYQVAFISAMCGAGFATATLQESDWILRSCSSIRQVASQLSGLLCTSALGICLVILGALWGGASYLNSPELWTSLGLTATHLSMLAVVLLQLPMGRVPKPLLLPIIGWILPSLLSTIDPSQMRVAAILSTHHDPALLQNPSQAGLLGSLGPILVLGAVVLFLKLERHKALSQPQ